MIGQTRAPLARWIDRCAQRHPRAKAFVTRYDKYGTDGGSTSAIEMQREFEARQQCFKPRPLVRFPILS